MPLKGFICTDKQKVAKEDCYNRCRLNNPCHTLRYLLEAGYDREWTGKPSCTQLINSTRLEYLKITSDYYINPDDRAFAILGTRSHWKLDKIAKSREEIISEYHLDGDQVGTLDCLEPDRTNGGYILTDNKTWGAYSVAKAQKGDIEDTELQLNFYRLKAETDQKLKELLGEVKINKLQIEAIVRDGGTTSAYKLGINKRTYQIPIKILDNETIINFFNNKAKLLLHYLNKKELPPVCTIKENWKWKRCKTCDVAEFCPEGKRIRKR